MRIPILIEPNETGRFRATAGQPFALSAEGQSIGEAAEHLAALLHERLKAGAQVRLLDIANGAEVLCSASQEPVPDDDWFFKTMEDAIEENRRRENEAAPWTGSQTSSCV